MMILPKNAVIIERKVEEVKTSLIGIEPKKLNRGMIVFTAEDLKHLQFCEIVFREAFVEDIKIENQDFVYLRDIDSGMYYIVKDDKKG